MSGESIILTINGGSSSIKFAGYLSADLRRTFGGRIERIGTSEARLIADGQERPVDALIAADGARQIVAYIKDRLGSGSISPRSGRPEGAPLRPNEGKCPSGATATRGDAVLKPLPGRNPVAAIGHRVVHGGLHLLEHQKITPAVIDELRRVIPMDLAHLPGEIELIEAFSGAFPATPQVACFDTEFFRDLPRVAQLLPIPRELSEQGLRRFGFHGLSYTYLMRRLEELAGPEAARGRVILAHLGAGASMAAVRDRKPIDTTMAFTPTAGLVMATRPGDIDPGLLLYLMRTQNLSATQMEQFIATRCGLLGISQTSADMRDLLARQASDPRAADAIDLFCQQAKKFLAALAATLGGIDTLVFSAGIGEHVPAIRAAICNGLEFLGIRLDPIANATSTPLISPPNAAVTVRVIPTDEERIIAQVARDTADR
jgi:acetate kinase